MSTFQEISVSFDYAGGQLLDMRVMDVNGGHGHAE